MDPQTCTKCSTLPQDILMLACSHDLCLNCASDRLAFQMKKKKNVNSIVCEFCYERTPLDAESIGELQKMIPSSKLPSKTYNEPTPAKYQTKVEPKSYANTRSPIPEPVYEKKTDRMYERTDRSRVGNNDAFQGIPFKKQCNEHPEQEILYFCFDCKCECICPECVIHGRHKDHDVKTIKKSQPIIKSQISSSIDRMENNVEGLLIKKSEVQKQVRSITEQNNVSKRQIQQAFDELRAKIDAQQRQILSKCDSSVGENVAEMNGQTKSIVERMEYIRSFTATLKEVEKKEDILFLNFYAKKWQQIKNEEKEPEREIRNLTIANNEPILSGVLDVSDQVSRIGASNHRNSRAN